jgi:hypothetical protein
MMNEVGHMGHSKVLGLTCLWAICVAHSNHRWETFLVLLDSSHQDFYNSIGEIIIGVLVYLQSLFLSFFFFSPLFLLILISNNFII